MSFRPIVSSSWRISMGLRPSRALRLVNPSPAAMRAPVGAITRSFKWNPTQRSGQFFRGLSSGTKTKVMFSSHQSMDGPFDKWLLDQVVHGHMKMCIHT